MIMDLIKINSLQTQQKKSFFSHYKKQIFVMGHCISVS